MIAPLSLFRAREMDGAVFELNELEAKRAESVPAMSQSK